MAKLVHSRDGTFINEYSLKEGELNIGRRPDCDIILDDTTVSGYHAKIIVKPNQYMDGLLDVHGRTVRRHLLKHDEVVRIGLHDLTLVDEHTRAFEETDILLPDQ
jgi:pSer/pThr/pTyr-binding forkhead associated (FHA) protein